MTEQTKIPLPGAGSGVGPATRSLIERAASKYDLGTLAPPPVPSTLPPPRINVLVAVAVEAPIAPAPMPGPAPAPMSAQAQSARQPDIEPAEAARDMIVTAPVSAPITVTPPPPAITAPAIVFSGPHAVIDRERLADQGMIVPEGSVTALLEEFRIVKRQLLLTAAELRGQGAGAKAQRILICSPHPGEGKTYTAVNLALSIAAEKDSEVLLVDADFAKPSVLTTLGLPGGRGLMDALSDPAIAVEDCVIRTDLPGLFVLPAGNATSSDSEFLSSARAAAVLDRLTAGAPQRIVIFDSPPALAASPAAELAHYVGQAVVVARADRTGQSALEDAVSLLSGCANIQLLLNAVQFSPTGRRFGSYYGYGG